MDKIIFEVEKGSIADKLGICPGDILTEINNNSVEDVFDYRFLITDTKVSLSIKRFDGSRASFKVKKNENEDLGIIFETGLMDKPKRCANKCVFCFIDQLPPGMRDSLYFKDDDPRLSFLHGNYVTLTNLSTNDINRLAFYHLSPINISVHTTDPELRSFMLNNPQAANLQEQIGKLISANIEMNFQVVLCKDINDGEHLDRTINDLGKLPRAHSLSIVPAGLTCYRSNLHKIEPFSEDDACSVIRQVEKWQRHFLDLSGTRFVYAADEFYLKSGLDFPAYEAYEDFPQLENGVGKFAVFSHEFKDALKKATSSDPKHNRIAIATGTAAYQFIHSLVNEFLVKFGLSNSAIIDVIEIENLFFGNCITVSGLLTGTDIIRNLKGCKYDVLLVPAVALRKDSTVFLDDIDIADLEHELDMRVEAIPDNGYDLVSTLLG